MNSDDRAIERLALVVALNTLKPHSKDTPAAEIVEALYVNAEALRRAAEIIDERARLIRATYPATRPPSQESAVRAAAAAGALLCACAIASAALHWAETPLPFSLDVALVYFLASLPLATSLAVAALAQLPRRGSTLAVFGLEAIVLVLIPRLYIHARCQNDLNQAAQLAGQFRYAEASALLHRVVALEPHATWNGNSASQAANSIDQIVRQVEAQIASPLTENATNADRLSRATNLAVLGRTTEALALLDSSDSLANSPEAHNLRGTIHESRNRWQLARDWYARAKAAWQTLPDSPDRTAGLKQAITGTAFCCAPAKSG
jgi:hypothetical protein